MGEGQELAETGIANRVVADFEAHKLIQMGTLGEGCAPSSPIRSWSGRGP